MKTLRTWLTLSAALLCGLTSTAAGPEQPQSAPGAGLNLQVVQDAPTVAPGLEQGTTTDPDDFYYFGNARIQLKRSRTEALIRFRDIGTAEGRQLSGPARTTLTVGEAVRFGQATFHIVSLPSATPPLTKNRASGSSTVLPNPLDLVRTDPAIEFVAPVFYHGSGFTRVLPTDEIVVRLRPAVAVNLATTAASYGLQLVRLMPGTKDQYVLRLVDPLSSDAVERSRVLFESGRFEWAQPNFVQAYQKHGLPNDPRFGNQWHLSNTGQGGGVAGADVKAVAAWDVTKGRSDVVIAIVDDGVEWTHEDLAPNIFSNPGEIPGNGVDDDANGFIDDVRGWDFYNGDNDPSPGPTDNHGTSVAGVAAARGDNGVGVTGACQNCRILPVKIADDSFASDVVIANAIRYAARYADVINNSWGGGAPSFLIQSAIADANTTGRGGKGAVVLFATGNSASGYRTFTITGFPAGTYTFRWQYKKDETVTSGEDAVSLGWIRFPGGELVTFENGFPAGWTGGGNAVWSIVTDPARADEGRCLTRSAKSGVITHNQTTYIQVTKFVPAGNLVTNYWPSSEGQFDGLQIFINPETSSFAYPSTPLSGVPAVTQPISYPAAHPEAIAVGASSNFDCRSGYSQFGPNLAFVAPSSAGPLNLGIETTDRMGTNGYDPVENYTQAFGASGFGGTSSATPLAAGIVGLMLSRNGALTRSQVLSTLQFNADKVGPEQYFGGRNDRYGWGRLNAYAALQAVPNPPSALTLLVSSVTQTTATLNAYVNPNGASTTVVFEYGPTTAYGSQVVAPTATDSGTEFILVTASLPSLACSTTYHYRAVASSFRGLSTGADQVFRTLECAGIRNLFLQHTGSGCMVAWHMSGVSLLSQDFLVPGCVSDPNWRISGVADFDADGRPDVLLQNIASGGILVWLMNGIVIKEQRFLTPPGVSDPNWRIAAVGNFDADGKPDLIIQHIADGRMLAWLLNGTVLKAQVFLNPSMVADPNWRIVGAGDIDLDGKSDLFFQNIASGFMVQWLMDGITIRRQDFLNPSLVPPDWRVSAIADVNGDTRPDMILQNINDGRMVAWPLIGPNLQGQLLLNPFQVSDPRWRIVGPR